MQNKVSYDSIRHGRVLNYNKITRGFAMPQLKAIIESQTAYYLSVINPEPTHPLSHILKQVSVFAPPLKHLTKEYGRNHAVAYLKEYDQLQDDEQVQKKLMDDMASGASVFISSTHYARELKIGLIAFLSSQAVDDVRQLIHKQANKALKQASRQMKSQYSSVLPLDSFIDKEIVSSLDGLQGKNNKTKAIFEL